MLRLIYPHINVHFLNISCCAHFLVMKKSVISEELVYWIGFNGLHVLKIVLPHMLLLYKDASVMTGLNTELIV